MKPLNQFAATGLLLATLVAPAALAQNHSDCAPAPGRRQHPPPAPFQFAVISDPHIYDARLGVSGAAFENYLNQDPKLLEQSAAIFEAALDRIIAQQVKFAIIPGDLTKDGELASHQLMARHLAKLERHGIQAFVVPGNHDLHNPHAVRFDGADTCRVPNIGWRTFRSLYQRFGYGQALECDRDSLSYVAEPVRGLWLLAIDSTDSCQNEELGYPEVGGKLSSNTLAWVQAKLQQAQARGKKVVAFMHHGVNPNSAVQPLLFPDWLVDDWPFVGAQFSAAGLKVVFTGHYHSQDIAFPLGPDAKPVLGGLADVETSSLAVFPNAFRIVTVETNGTLNIASQRVTDIACDTGGLSFPEFAEADLRARLPALAAYRLEKEFGATPEQAQQLAPFVVEALMAGYAGDETLSAPMADILKGFVASPEPLHSLGLLLFALWTDLPPTDNNWIVPMSD